MMCGSSQQLSFQATATPTLSSISLRRCCVLKHGLRPGWCSIVWAFMRPVWTWRQTATYVCHGATRFDREHVELQPRVCIMFASATRPAKRALNTLDFRIVPAHSTSLMSGWLFSALSCAARYIVSANQRCFLVCALPCMDSEDLPLLGRMWRLTAGILP
ncbi:hypothetical protein BKA80DRAFT_23644 [Phyllosticta citrichinensis]